MHNYNRRPWVVFNDFALVLGGTIMIAMAINFFLGVIFILNIVISSIIPISFLIKQYRKSPYSIIITDENVYFNLLTEEEIVPIKNIEYIGKEIIYSGILKDNRYIIEYKRGQKVLLGARYNNLEECIDLLKAKKGFIV